MTDSEEPKRVAPGWEGSVGPFSGEDNIPHAYARDIYNEVGDCVCHRKFKDPIHIQAAPGVPMPWTTHWSPGGDLLADHIRLRRCAWLVNGGPRHGTFIQDLDQFPKSIPHGSFTPVYFEVGD